MITTLHKYLKHEALLLISIIAAIAIVSYPLQHLIALSRYQHYSFALDAVALGFLLQMIFSWRSFIWQARLSHASTSIYLAMLAYTIYNNPWLDVGVAQIEEKFLTRLLISLSFGFGGFLVGLLWLVWTAAESDQEKKEARKKLMKRLVLLLGIPASGKTTLAKQLIAKDYTCLNADAIRLELWGDPADQRQPEKVFEIFFLRLEEAMAAGLDIVIDNTNINSRHRNPILERAAKAGYTDIQLWVLDVPLAVCLERNRARERAVPDDIVSNMHRTLQGAGRPLRVEGKVVVVRPGRNKDEFRFFTTR